MSDDALIGRLIITWPKPSSDRAVFGALIVLIDADTGLLVTSATDLTVHADVRGVVTAEVTMLCDQDGAPLLDPQAEPVRTDDGESVRTGVFHWLVAEMRTQAEVKEVSSHGGH